MNEYYNLENFEWDIYLDKNPDLVKNGINTMEKAITHFKTYGKNEKRFINKKMVELWENYDWIKYKNNNLPKLNNLDEWTVFFYYCFIGLNNKDIIFKKEEISFFEKEDNHKKYYYLFKTYDWNKYLNDYQDLKNNNIKTNFECFIHYITQGKNEDRQIYKKIENISNINEDKNIIEKINKNNNNNVNIINNIKEDKNIIEKINKNNNDDNNYIPKFFKFTTKNNYKDKFKMFKYSFVISSYNNEENIYNNLLSVILQTYTNWEIYYINDNSTDKTEELFFKIIEKYNVENKVFYTKNKINMKQAYNKYQSYQKIDKNNIIVILDGDDWLTKNNILEELNKIYLIKDCWMTYSGYFIYENDNIIKSININKYDDITKMNGDYRKHENWNFNHLRTGYAWLFKMIPQEYLILDNKWIDRCTDWAELYPCAELAKDKIYEINDNYYIYNKTNSLNYPISYYRDKDSPNRKKIELYIKSCPKLTIEIPKIFIINLEKDIKEKKRLLNQFELHNINNFEFFKAIYAIEHNESIELYKKYIINYNNNKIPKKIFGVEKLHINSIGALGVIQSTLKMFQYINNTTNLDHVIILEDDIYFIKNFINQFHITNIDLKNCDFMYIGHNCANKQLLYIRNKEKKNIFDIKEEFSHINIYGAYGFICSRNFREFVIQKGINYFIDNNLNLDCFYATLYKSKDNNLKIKLYNEHLVIPEVRKDGIQKKRGDEFYIERDIDLNKYDME